MSKINRKKFVKRTLSLESLENRELMAADLGVYFDNAGLHLVESAGYPGGDNAAQITQVSPGIVRVTGLAAQDGGMSSINGHTSQDFPAPANGGLFVSLGGGSDTLVVGGTSQVTFKTINIDVSAPNANTVDNDKVTLNNVKTSGSVDITTGLGADVIAVNNSTIGDGLALNHLVIASGKGADNVSLNNVTVKGYLDVYSYTALTETDPDVVTMLNTVATDNMQVFTAAGIDNVSLTQVTVGKELDVLTGDGNDKLTLNSVQAMDNFYANLGNGNDTANVQFLRANNATLDGGAGSDSLNYSVPGTINHLTIKNWETYNGKKLLTVGPGQISGITTVKQ